MAKHEVTNLLNFGSPIIDDNLDLSHDEILSVIDDKKFSEKYDVFFQRYLEYLSSISGVYDIGIYHKYLKIDINEQTHESIMTFSLAGLKVSLANMLNCLDYEKEITLDELKTAIKELKKIKDEKELAIKFPYLYKEDYLPNKEYVQKYGFLIFEYERAKKDLILFNKLKKRFQEVGSDLERQYALLKRSANFENYINSVAKHFLEIIKNFDNIKVWIKENPIEIKLSEYDVRKIFLYILYREFENLIAYFQMDFKFEAQKNVIIIENLIKKYKNLFPADTTQIKINRVHYIHENEKELSLDANNNIGQNSKIITTDFDLLVSSFEIFLEEYPFFKRGVELPNISKEMDYEDVKEFVSNYINSILTDTINQNINDGAKELDNTVVEEQIKELEEDIRTGSLTEKEINVKKLILKKIKMVLVDIKPIAKQTGIGVFSSYYTYFYPNGMVAIDKLSGYGALYIMPIHIYKEARYKKNLSEVRMLPGVKYVTHKGLNWLEDAKNYILEGTSNLSERDIRDAEFAASIDFPYTIEEMEKLQESLEDSGQYSSKVKEETEKRKKKIQLLIDIDDELTSTEGVIYDLSNEQLNQEIDGLIDTELPSFDELYTFWKNNNQNKKYKRNPVVAKITKSRARDIDGNYCCELCGAKNFEHSSFEAHHMIPLGNGGIDNIYNTVCLCPNCHQYAHSGKMTLYQQYYLFDLIRKHIKNDNPEYLMKFDKMISPIAETEEYYQEHKDEIDYNFSILWNGSYQKTKQH